MERRFERELEGLKTSLIKMGSVVEENVSGAVRALLEGDEALAQRVIAADQRVNSLELEIDNTVIDLLALQQPVASDLRFIIAAQKINNDLERIGDHAVNIAEGVPTLKPLRGKGVMLEVPRMCEIALEMLKNAIDGFVTLDADLAHRVLGRDDLIDELNRKMTNEVIEQLRGANQTIECGLELIRVSRNLERVGDLATNIAEEVIFHTQARVVKHHADELRKRDA